jgi:hypothetical protein
MQQFKHNASDRSLKSYQDYYTSDEDISIVKNKFVKDIDWFKYQF